MATTQLTEQNFEEMVTAHDVVVIDFWAAWCGPCRSFAPIYEVVSERYPNVLFAKVDTETEQTLAAAFNIMSIPTLMIMRENVVIFNQAGALPESALEQLIKEALKIDMQEVHRMVLEEEGARP